MFAKIDLFVSFMTNTQSFKFSVLKDVMRTSKATVDTRSEEARNDEIIDVNNNINSSIRSFLDKSDNA